ncbi:hypothetical protein ACLUWG_04060 [Bifidobacterium apri]|uniref:hypothetical protein n=3 Tax=Bifidobacterium TaxID=1678 RepID=UPI00399472E3
MKRMRNMAISILCSCLILAGAAPAFAEGSFNTSMTGVRPGFNSRVWNKRVNDHTSTTVHLAQCSNPYGFTTLELRRVISMLPDQSKGKITLRCNNGTANWGAQSTGDYKFRVTSTPDNASMSVGSVTVTY